MRLFLLYTIGVVVLAAGCTSPSGDETTARVDTTQSTRDTVMTGARVLAEEGFRRLQGQRVGLVVNHTARVDTTHLIDLIDQAPDVELAALFGPEHGLRGTAGAGEEIESNRDPRTGVPVYSLYGQDRRRPTPEMLDGLDVLVFDIQDIGARFYTYITTMGLTMQSAAEADLPFLVLDRPNPIGGREMGGFVLNEEYASFVGRYPVPIQHGMTVGELARMIQGEQLLDGLDALELDVVPTAGWQRSMLWPETGLDWIPPSPNIPDFETALLYPGAAFFEATSASEGRGTDAPFKLVGAPWADGSVIADTLNARSLPGVRFEAASFTPQSMPGAPSPKLEGRSVEGIRYVITNQDAFRPVATGVHLLHAFYHQAPSKEEFLSRPDWLARLAGTEQFHDLLRSEARPDEIIAAWRDDIEEFQKRRQPYLIYD